VSPVKGAICVELTIGSKTLPTTLFVISGKGAYNLLLGRDWIHANCCIPSNMHQCLVQWVGDKIEIVLGDSSYVIASQRQTPMKELGVFQEKFGRKIFSRLLIMKFHRSKQSVLMKVFNG
jgi:hypothetical protein